MSGLIRLGLHVAAPFLPGVRANLATDAGDVCRAAHDWNRAAAHYARAVAIRPKRRAVWVQLGHALKEAGRFDEALDAYRHASALPGTDGDAPQHHSILARRLGHRSEAREALQQAVREMAGDVDSQAERLLMLHDPLSVSEAAARAAAELAHDEIARLAAAGDERSPVIFDVSDLVSYFRHSRLPTGIQRVQIEVIRGSLATARATQICFFKEAGAEEGWTRIPAAHFLSLAELATAGADLSEPAWTEAIEILTAMIEHGGPPEFDDGAFLVNLGTSWWLKNYFLHLRAVQRRHAICYVPFIHDVIPILAPEHCVRELTQDYIDWVLRVFDHVGFYLANSRSTASDLMRVATMIGRDVPADRIAVVPLDADFCRTGQAVLAESHLADWDLKPGDFALFVATIEPRKNHGQAFRAWQILIERYGVDVVPDLACVGNRGWLADPVYAALEADPLLKSKVRMLGKVSDAELELLYRTCRFTVYPSMYEGWGLPVTESLCHGKVPIVTSNSSLSEAGGDLALYVDLNDDAGLARAIETLVLDPARLGALEARIRTGFEPRSWQTIASQIGDELAAFMDRAPEAEHLLDVPMIALDRHYRFSRNQRTRVAAFSGIGELFRAGTAWGRPEDWGCYGMSTGSDLAFRLPPGVRTVRCWLRLRGPAGHGNELTIHTGERTLCIPVAGERWNWVSFLVHAEDGVVALRITGRDEVDLSWQSGFQDQRIVGFALGSLIVTDSSGDPGLDAVAGRIAVTPCGPFEFVEAIYPLFGDNEADPAVFMEFLPPLETGAMDRADVIAACASMTNRMPVSERCLIFD